MELDEKDKAGVDFTTAVKLSPQDYGFASEYL